MAAREIFPIQDFRGNYDADFRPISDAQRAYEEEVANAATPLGAVASVGNSPGEGMAPAGATTTKQAPVIPTFPSMKSETDVSADMAQHPSASGTENLPPTGNDGSATPPALTPPSIPTSSSPSKDNQAGETKPSSSASGVPSANDATSSPKK